MGQNLEQLLFVEVADETKIAAHGVEGRITLTLGRSIAITQFPKQGLHDFLVRNALVRSLSPRPLQRERELLDIRLGSPLYLEGVEGGFKDHWVEQLHVLL